MFKFIWQLTAVMLLSISTGAMGQAIDGDASSISFTITNLGINVDGGFSNFSGQVKFMPDNLAASKFQIAIEVKSVYTGNDERDTHLQEEEYFDAAKHPEITFVSQKVARKNNQFVVSGTLTIKGVSQQVSIPFWYQNQTFSGSLTVNRQDYNVGGDGFLNPIGDKVKIQIECRLKG